MTKIGILTNAFELPRSERLIHALKQISGVEVEVLIEERDLISSKNPLPVWDLCFIKGRGLLLQALALRLEYEGIPIHNCPRAIYATNHRILYSSLAQSAGIPQPEFVVCREDQVQFDEYVIKLTCVESTLKFPPLFGRRGAPTTREGIYYFQKVVHSDWEYKVYSFGNQFLFYKEVPTAVNPDKSATRVQIPDNPLLQEYVEKIKQVTHLTVTSIDFLFEDGQFYLTDVNSAPNFNYIRRGPEILARWLADQARS